MGAWYQIEVTVDGTPEQRTGYLATLAELDASVRLSVIPILQNALFLGQTTVYVPPAALLHEMSRAVADRLTPRLSSLTWNLSPYHTYHWEQTMPSSTTLTAVFEFAASHRLNDPTRSPAENQAFFGKCNKLNGHGHNYHLEVSIAVSCRESTFGMAELEAIVSRTVIDRFDHMNLNIDCPEFHAFNPSVEHIASVCFDLLNSAFCASGVELRRVRLWETSKTSATIEAESATRMG